MQENITQENLLQAKKTVKLFAMDYDGTLADGEHYHREDAINLIESILKANKTPAFITARAATAVKTFVPPLQDFYVKYPNSTATYIGGGNGTVLYKLDSKGLEKIYNHGLSLEEIKTIVSVWEKYAEQHLPQNDLSEKGLTTFIKFYGEDWQDLIPNEILEIGKVYNGRIFTEEAKVTFVFPQDISTHEKIVSDMRELLGNNFSISAGDKDFCHITKALKEDGKMVAVKTVLELMDLKENEVATFGDMPHGNDKGLLSFPYSFTNYLDHVSQTPPYILAEDNLPPVGRVYKAIKFLIE